MPNKPKKPCSYAACSELTTERYCDKHKHNYDRYRGTATDRGYDYRWQQARKIYLHKHPLCVECLKLDRFVEATVIDHIDPHRGDKAKFWNVNNWQSLCKACHDVKTAKGL